MCRIDTGVRHFFDIGWSKFAWSAICKGRLSYLFKRIYVLTHKNAFFNTPISYFIQESFCRDFFSATKQKNALAVINGGHREPFEKGNVFLCDISFLFG